MNKRLLPKGVEVDKEDLSLVESLGVKWRIDVNRYTVASTPRINGSNQGRIYLGRFLLGLKHGDRKNWADHIDGNPLNNCRSNLRIVTPAQNNQNRGIARNNKSGYPGVNWKSEPKNWEVRVNNKYYGRFKSLEEAIVRRKRAEQELYGLHSLSLSRI